MARRLDLHVSGLEHVPPHGPVILAARHYHHLYDAAAVLASLPREVHVVVALDWLGSGPALHAMRGLVAAARWPGVWRRGPAWRLNRAGYAGSLSLLREGRVLLVFPEGYPTIDPAGSRRTTPFLPFDAGFLSLAERARPDVAVVPVGLRYAPRPGGGWQVWLRYGRPIAADSAPRAERWARLASVESAVRALSTAPSSLGA